MSEYTSKTGLSSILKNYSSVERDKLKLTAINKVRFGLPKERGLLFVVEDVINNDNYFHYREFLEFLSSEEVTDADFLRIIKDGRNVIHSLKFETFPGLIEALMSLDWITRDEKTIECFKEFVVDILVAHNKYANIVITKLISLWIPNESTKEEWLNGPNKKIITHLENVHDLILRLTNVMPILNTIVCETLENLFPYFKKPPYQIGGYIYNCLWLLRYRPDFMNVVIDLLIRNLLKMDVNAPRNEIEEAEDEYNTNNDIAEEAMFQIEGFSGDTAVTMVHEVAEVLDVCLKQLFEFSKKIYDDSIDSSRHKKRGKLNFSNYFSILLEVFGTVILPSHNTHHVQFLIFHCCSFKFSLAEKFLTFLWEKIINPNVSAPIRQVSIGYLASFLSRAKYIPLSAIKNYLLLLSNWAHQYIERSDSIRSNNSLKANLVFFAVCQAIFYIIAFRSRELTKDKSSLLFLQSLRLPALVTCTFNPLRVCLPAIATAFAGVTRTYQLAYCHTILERNARRKLATVYANELMTPEECLDTFFPFDPYLLKKSGKFVAPLYLQYQANDIEETHDDSIDNSMKMNRRKRGDSEMEGDDVDDFIMNDKKLKSELSRSHEMQFTYGLSPGFHF
ncbi:RNA polymerase I-specific transcription initiation factor RRN3 [Condylostylus longicornis]|uniref:RNA polymerase I-specific transcription initiation factor RRN3 n=1 Tax=Condylostylus longicornis TaxID=2530218 RepID=UPI00244DF56F|nr:RNA polymerase I-specific transcription initiation factor RRN3 [Condylostylus longicornis]